MNGNTDWDITVQSIIERDEEGEKVADALEGSFRKIGSGLPYATVYARSYEELFETMGKMIAIEDAKDDSP